MPGTGQNQTKVLMALSASECVFLGAIKAETGLTARAVSNAVCRLITRGYVARVEVGCYQLTDAGRHAQETGVAITSGPSGPHAQSHGRKMRKKTLRDRAWKAIRMKAATGQSFTVGDITAIVVDGGEKNPRNNVEVFIRQLFKAKYLHRLPRKRGDGEPLTSNGEHRYRLRKDTGPLKPVIRTKTGEVFDPNIDGGSI